MKTLRPVSCSPPTIAAELLSQTIDSVLDQSDADLELIVVDDGSSDATPAILPGHARSRVRAIRLPNAGVTRALIAGCAAAQGKYIARQDAGDVSSLDRLQRQRAAAGRGQRCHPGVVLDGFRRPELEPLWIARGNGKASPARDVARSFEALSRRRWPHPPRLGDVPAGRLSTRRRLSGRSSTMARTRTSGIASSISAEFQR